MKLDVSLQTSSTVTETWSRRNRLSKEDSCDSLSYDRDRRTEHFLSRSRRQQQAGFCFYALLSRFSFMFLDLTERLSDQFLIFVPDYPGYGYSDAPFEYTFDRLADIRRKYRFSSYRTLLAFNDLSSLDPAAHRCAAFFSVRKSAQSNWNQRTAAELF